MKLLISKKTISNISIIYGTKPNAALLFSSSAQLQSTGSEINSNKENHEVVTVREFERLLIITCNFKELFFMCLL